MSIETSRPDPLRPLSSGQQKTLQFLFVATLTSSALLMFLVQPMVGKALLASLGGTPQVWNTCMVFFQTMLFAGYLHAHYTGKILGLKRQAIVHLAIALAALLFLPFGVAQTDLVSLDTQHPVLWLMRILFVSVGVPVFLIAATAPLLQVWFAHSRHPAASDPYFLYAASNCGSLIALIAYPAVIEPLTNLRQQWAWWGGGFVLFVGMLVACALLLRRDSAGTSSVRPVTKDRQSLSTVRGTERLRWLLLSFIPSSLLLGITTHITTDIAPVPLFWVVPLALYLITFIMAFTATPLIHSALAQRIQAFAVTLVAVMTLTTGITVAAAPVSISLHLIVFFFTALVCHVELYRLRPPAHNLTEFYLWLSLGGLLGGVFNALIAPIVFSQLIEYPLVLVAACALRPLDGGSMHNKRRSILDVALPFGLAAVAYQAMTSFALLGDVNSLLRNAIMLLAVAAIGVALLSFSHRPMRFALGVGALMCVLPGIFSSASGSVGYSARTFFGAYKVTRNETLGLNVFSHGTTVHGAQYIDPSKSIQPLSYYHQDGPFGDLFAAVAPRLDGRPVALVGLGVGALTCYGKKGDTWTFYEIDPLVEKVARDERFFTFLRDCPPTAKVVIGDARMTLGEATDHSLALIVIDAFTSDSIPTHLLTREALGGYLKKLAPDGVLALHISNRHLKLAPVIASLARDAGLTGRVRTPNRNTASTSLISSQTELVVLATSVDALGSLMEMRAWAPLQADPNIRVWTDDYVNIIGALN